MKRIKRIICIILAALIIVTAPMTSYMTANATEGVITLGLIDTLLGLFGVSSGLGSQDDFWSQSNMDYIFDGIKNSGSVSIGSYGNVDFSSDTAVRDWLNYSLNVNASILTDTNPLIPITKDQLTLFKAFDKTAYFNTGTSATNAFADYVSSFLNNYDSDSLAGDIVSSMTLFNNDASFNGLNPADKIKCFNTFFAMTAASLLSGHGDLALDSLFRTADTTFTDYDAAFEDLCFDGTYQTNANGEYVYNIVGSNSSYRYYIDGDTSVYKIIGLYSPVNNSYSFCRLNYDSSHGYYLSAVNLYACKQVNVNNGLVYGGKSINIIGDIDFSGNIPIYSSEEAALAALQADDFSGAENLNDAYRSFKSSAGIAGHVIGDALKNYVGSLSSLNDLIDIFPAVKAALDSKVGTADALPAVSDTLTGAVPAPSPEPDDPTDTKDYTGILGKILLAINSITLALNNMPTKLVNSFAGKFITATALADLLNTFPELYAKAFCDAFGLPANQSLYDLIQALPKAYADSLVDVIPVALVDALTIAFPRAKEADESIIAIPDAIRDIAITVPDIKIPEIVIPETVIPDIAVYPAITLDPTYDITVANDYTGLDAIIAGAVAGVLTDLFVPDQAVTMAKIGAIQAYFVFKDDIIGAFDDLKTMIFGITPSPILKIPIGAETSKYNYGLGSYIIIDISWYAPYKQFGDKIILAICWALFIWRLYIKLPGIISGAEGSIVATDKAYDRYTRTNSKKGD